MLSSRTKQINAYGRRGKRIIDAPSSSAAADAEETAVPTKIVSIFDDLPPPAPRGSLASRMKQRENIVPTSKPKSASVLQKVVGLQKKRRLSPVLSPVKRKVTSRASELRNDLSLGRGDDKAKKKPNKLSLKSLDEGHVDPSSPIRAPLSPCVLNMPRSPAVRARRKTVMSTATPSKLRKTFNPFVDVDITVLDKDGNTISKEKRVSTDKATFSALTNHAPAKKAIRRRSPSPSSSSNVSESEAPPPKPLRSRRQTARKHIVVSDDDDSDDDEYVEPVKEQNPRKSMAPSRAKSKPATIAEAKPLQRTGTASRIVEVVVPPLPYKIARIQTDPKPSTIPPAPLSLPDVTSDNEPSLPELSQDSFQQQQREVSRYNPLPSPPLRPRQLTPIKAGARRRLYEPPSPPPPITPTDLSLSLDFSGLDLNSLQELESQANVFEAPQYLSELLEECNQTASGPHNFSAFIDTFPFDPVLKASRESSKNGGEGLRFRKIGEASYSEVFGIGDVVLKVIPLRDESVKKTSSGIDEDEDDGPSPSDARDVRKEIVVTRAMGEVHDGFVKLLKTYVVKGRYPEVLLGLWDEYNDKYGSESVRPDTFKLSQIYTIIVLPNGGPDLEAFTFSTPTKTGWKQACSIFWQVTKSLAHAETLVSFEHRDLHWGQILVKTAPTSNGALKPLATNNGLKGKVKSRRPYMDDPSHGLQTTVIDLGLSRMDAGDGSGGASVHWTPFDEEVFEGEGDYQFDVYRVMRDLTKGAWEGYHPTTNVFWLHYLLHKLITAKGLKPPSATTARKPKGESLVSGKPSTSATGTTTEGPFTEKECYECLVDLERWLAEAVAHTTSDKGLKAKVLGKSSKAQVATVSAAPRKPGRPRKAAELPLPPTSGGSSEAPKHAGEVLAYGVKRGWVRSSMPV